MEDRAQGVILFDGGQQAVAGEVVDVGGAAVPNACQFAAEKKGAVMLEHGVENIEERMMPLGFPFARGEAAFAALLEDNRLGEDAAAGAPGAEAAEIKGPLQVAGKNPLQDVVLAATEGQAGGIHADQRGIQVMAVSKARPAKGVDGGGGAREGPPEGPGGMRAFMGGWLWGWRGKPGGGIGGVASPKPGGGGPGSPFGGRSRPGRGGGFHAGPGKRAGWKGHAG